MISYDDLKRIDFFADLTDEELTQVQNTCSEESYHAGGFIFSEDSPANHLYVLKNGKVSIDIKVSGGKYLSVYTVSQFAEPFGWSAIVEPFLFTASARCVVDSTVFSIDRKLLVKLIERDYRMGFLIMQRVAKIISQRVRETRLQLIHTFYG
ncbi:MAG: cyclic nucleotide-binding domain-containing protein [Nitrospirae bacterium]|nr:cyclic nucleotide-binding domain-containing protein [Nitrospirota bacterium]